MNIALILLGVVCVGSCAALPGGLDGYGGNPFMKQARSVENNVSLNYTKQPRIPQFKLNAIHRNTENYVKCSKKTKKVKLVYGDSEKDWAYFESPDHPEDYPSKTSCKWQFKSTEDITVECFDVNLQKAKKDKCKDELKIDSKKYCGSEPHISYGGKTSVKVQFKSDKKKNYSGFFCFAYVGVYEPSTTFGPPGFSSTEVPPTDEPNSSCNCGQANQVSRIVGGEETDVNEFPWQAAMVYKHTTEVFCGASVIGSKHVLTAAHCTQALTDYDIDYQVLVGAHSLSNAASSQQKINPSKFIQHEDYDDSTIDNDIAIIVLSKSISFASSEISPVCLPTSDADDYDSVDAIVSGWGALKQGGSGPDVLMEVTVPTMTNKKCKDYYGGGITDTMLCAGFKKGKKDSCQGDSGGPLIYNSGSSYTQIGVVSWGAGCAQPKAPGVYARVTKYLTWISENSASSTKCPAKKTY